jgi:uncharacterized protein YsxB (DUF464 family)
LVDIVVGLDGRGALRRLDLKGHAGDSPIGENPACAAVTLMARSVARLAASRTGWTVDGTAPEPGNLSLVIKGRPEDTDEWLRGVTDTLTTALADIAEEYPGAISVSIEENHDGS